MRTLMQVFFLLLVNWAVQLSIIPMNLMKLSALRLFSWVACVCMCPFLAFSSKDTCQRRLPFCIHRTILYTFCIYSFSLFVDKSISWSSCILSDLFFLYQSFPFFKICQYASFLMMLDFDLFQLPACTLFLRNLLFLINSEIIIQIRSFKVTFWTYSCTYVPFFSCKYPFR